MRIFIFALAIFTVIFNNYCESKPARTPLSYKAGVTDEILTAIQKCNVGEKLPEMMKLILEGSYAEDDNFKKFVYCVFKESGFSLENGRINVEKTSQAFDGKNDEMEKVIKDCDKPVGDPIAYTFEYFKCFQDNSPYLLHL